ncbi:MAG: TonB-dependent receptor [Bacteroidales bacterium]|nr:TonB-dependent receptor [Bacteroidales bacterium]
MRKVFLVGLFLLMIPMALIAQNVRVTGKVVDVANNEPLIGVNVVQQGTTNGTITDLDGNYSIEVPSNSTIQFSFIGYVTQSIAVNGKNSIDCYLSSDDKEIEQVVVVGYGTQRKEAVTGSVASVKGDVMREMPGSNITQSLQGRIAGVDMQQSSSKPGATMRIRVRGTRSLNASNDPLVVLDGVPFAGNLSDIDPNSIKSIDILKDASATAIYGSRGANGVILVTTTKGSLEQDATITYSGYYGVKTVFSQYKMMDAEKFKTLREYAGKYSYGPEEEEGVARGTNTNWQDLMYDNGMVTSHDLSITGGTKTAAYSVGAGYYKEEAVLPLQNYNRFSLRASLDQKIGKYIKVGLTSNNNYSINNGNGIGVSVLDYSPLVSPEDASGNRRRLFDNNTVDKGVWMRTRETLEEVKDNGDWEEKALTYGTFNSLYAELSIPYVEGLKYRVNTGLNMRYTQNGGYTGVGVFAQDPASPSSGSLGKSLDLNWAVENLLTYNRIFAEKHSINLVGLISFERDQYHSSYISASGIASKKFLYYNLARINDDGSTSVAPGSQNYSESGLKSAMARLMYSYDDRYMLTVAVRNDKSSRLAPSRNSHTYPAVSVGWNIGKESFMSDISWLDSFKLRLGYGQTSNQAVSPFKTLGLLATRPYNFGNDTYSTGYYVQELANDQLGWEYSETMNYGVDFGFLKRITGSFEYYVQKTKDVLLSVKLPSTSGVSSYMDNIGKTQNKGWEFNVNVNILNDYNGFTWDAGVNMYSNKNELVELASGADRDEGNCWFVGHPINSIYDYENIGLWQPEDYYQPVGDGSKTLGEVLEPGSDAGMIRVKYTGEYENGVPVRQIGPDDRQIMHIDPKLQGGFNTRLEYKNFDLNIIGAFQVGGKLICTLYSGGGYLNMLSGRRNNVDVDYFWAERDENTGKIKQDANGNYMVHNANADYPDPKTVYSGDNPKYASTLGFFDASFCKIRTITLGYNFKNKGIKWMDEIGIKKFRVYATIQNPFVIASKFHKETGLDPETNSFGNQNVAVVSGSYRASQILTVGTNNPSTRTFLFGLNVTF